MCSRRADRSKVPRGTEGVRRGHRRSSPPPRRQARRDLPAALPVQFTVSAGDKSFQMKPSTSA